MKIARTQLARKNLEKIAKTFKEVYDPDLGKVYFSRILQAIQNLKTDPLSAKIFDQNIYGVARYFIEIGDYHIFFEVYETHIYILSVLPTTLLPDVFDT